MGNKEKKAIKVLQEYIKEVDNISNTKEGNIWKAKVIDSLQLYIGKEAALLKKFNSTHFTEKVDIYDRDIGTYPEYHYKPEYKLVFINILNDSIHHIKNHGLQQNYVKTNFLSQFSTPTILGGVITIGGLIFSVGVFYKDIQTHREINQANDTIANLTYRNNKLVLESKEINEAFEEQSKYVHECDSLFLNQEIDEKKSYHK